MGLIRTALEEFQKKYIRPLLRAAVGMNEYDREMETIRWIINKGLDIKSFPKADGVLRKVQLCDMELLRIFNEICMKHSLTYWLDYGTLLGAVRHGDFIPWDDDLDIAMPRKDYEKIREILPSELSDSGIEFIDMNEKRLALTIWKAGCLMDISPMDKVSARYIKDEDDLRCKLKKCRKQYKHNAPMTAEDIIANRESVIGLSEGPNPIWYHNIEFRADETYYNDSAIFPLKKHHFGEYLLWIPNDSDAYLRETYGDYMSYPKNDILHHHATSNRIYENSIKYAVDLDVVLKKLKSIHVK